MTMTGKTMMAGLAAAVLMLSYPTGKAVAAAPKAPAGAMFGYQGKNLDFELVNRTGYELKHVLVAPAGTPKWSWDDDVLHGRRFEDNTKLNITFPHYVRARHWDIRVYYDNDAYKDFLNLNLDDIHKVTLWYDHRADKTRAEIE